VILFSHHRENQSRLDESLQVSSDNAPLHDHSPTPVVQVLLRVSILLVNLSFAIVVQSWRKTSSPLSERKKVHLVTDSATDSTMRKGRGKGSVAVHETHHAHTYNLKYNSKF
jgi:hypothetical protein